MSPNPIKKNVPGKMNKKGVLKLYIIFGAYALYEGRLCCIKVKIYKNVHINSLNPTIAEKTRK